MAVYTMLTTTPNDRRLGPPLADTTITLRKGLAMRTTLAAFLALGLSAWAVGCTDEQQLENAREDLQEEQQETQETINEATEDGVVTEEDREDIAEEREETQDAAQDVQEQRQDLREDTIE